MRISQLHVEEIDIRVHQSIKKDKPGRAVSHEDLRGVTDGAEIWRHLNRNW
jgi:hypothetical protein